MAIEDRDLKPGTKLWVTYKKTEYRAEVVAGEDGKVRYRLADGREFKSPSSMGTAVTGKACNGWTFWSVEESYEWAETDDDDGDESSVKTFRRVPNQRGVAEGDVRLYCNTCGKSFTTSADAQPETCPEGHKPDDGKVETTTK